MYRLRFHGRGGQGMKTSSRIIGHALFLQGYEVQDAPRYGAERRGAPLFAYVRAAHQPINERGVIDRPDLVVVADDTLLAIPAAGVLQGLDRRSVMLINSHDGPLLWRQRLNIRGTVIILPAIDESADRAELPYISAACAGATARLLGVITTESLEQAIRNELCGLGEGIVAANLERAQAAYAQMGDHEGVVQEGGEIGFDNYTTPEWIDLPFEEAHTSAPVIHGALTSNRVNTGLWRTLRPVIDYDRCNRCWWICSTFCPDGVIAVDKHGVPEIDYDHCKGCMVCVARCPPHAIQTVPEHDAAALEVTA